jgi:transcriptional regulator GlxA family with amidase domain
VLRDIDDSRAVLLRVLQNAEQRSIATRVVEEMCDGLPRHARMTLQFIARHLREPLDVPSIAAGLGVSRRTLHHRLEQAGSPSASELVGWCRVAFIAHQLSTVNASMATIASQLDEPSWRNLNYLLRRYLGMGAQQLRRPGAFAETVATFHAAFAPRARVPAVSGVNPPFVAHD